MAGAPPPAASVSAAAPPSSAPSANPSPPAASTPPVEEDRPVADPPWEPTPKAIERAKELYNEGTAAVQKGDLQAAFRAFRGSYEQDGGVEALANMAVVERALGRSRAAAQHLDAAMERLPTSQAGKLADLKERFADICKDITVLRLEVTAVDAQVYVDRVWFGGGPLSRAAYVDPGAHTITIRSPSGRETNRYLLAKKGTTEMVRVGPADVAPEPPAPAVAPAAVADGGPSLTPWIVGGVGLAFAGLGGAGLGVYLRAHDWRTKIDQDTERLGGSCSPPTPGFADDCRARSQEASNETIGAVLGISGAVGLGGLGLGGLMVWIASSSSSSSSPRRAGLSWSPNAGTTPPGVAVRVVPSPGGLVLQGQF